MFKTYLRELSTPPPALTRGQQWLFAALAVAVAISRRFALANSPLDWDESLFACGVRGYDVVAEHPHSPGYPLFILFAKLARLVVPDDFHAVQAVASVASLLLFPAVFFLLRELRFRFRVAVAGSLITVFLPTVWYYGGTALSDVPALCGVAAASALLLAGRRDPRAWVAGMVVAAIVGGIRPVHVVIAVIPAILGAIGARRRTLVAGCALFVAIVAASYTGAALATQNPPWGDLYKTAEMMGHIHGTDSFANQERPPLRTLAPMFFLDPQRGGGAGVALLVLAAIGALEGVARRRVNVAIVLAMFVPQAIASWIMLDTSAATRYALAYILLYSVLGAYGIDVVARLPRNGAVQSALVAAGAIALVVAFIQWTRPALWLVRHQLSPPVAAMRWIRRNVPAAGPRLYLADLLHFHAWYQLADYDTHRFDDGRDIPADAYKAGNYCFVDALTMQPYARFFSFPHERLAEIARRSYFDVSVIPMSAMIRFGDGWYQDESDSARHTWRWMQQSSTTLFPPLGSDGVLHLVFHLPLDALPRSPKLTIIWNGTVIDDRVCKDFENDRRYVVASRAGAPNECRILLDETARANGDSRHFGLQLLGVSWERADGLPYAF